MSQYGLVYIISNKKQGENIFKVGKTSKTINTRLKQLNSETGLIGSFKVYASFLVDDIDEAEKVCHQELDEYRIQDNREFFEIKYFEILEIVRECIKNYILKEFIEVKLSPKELKAINLKKLKQKKEYKGLDTEEDLESLINKKKNIEKIKLEKEQIQREKVQDFIIENEKIFNEKIKKLKEQLKKYNFIKFYKHPDVQKHNKKTTKWRNGWDIVISKKDSKSISESIKLNKLYESIVLSYSKGIPYNSEQKKYIKGSVLEDYYFATHSTYQPMRRNHSCDDQIINISFSYIGSGSLSLDTYEEEYRSKGFLDSKQQFGHVYNFGKVFKLLQNYFASKIAGEKLRYGFFYVDFEDQDKDIDHAIKLMSDI